MSTPVHCPTRDDASDRRRAVLAGIYPLFDWKGANFDDIESTPVKRLPVNLSQISEIVFLPNSAQILTSVPGVRGN